MIPAQTETGPDRFDRFGEPGQTGPVPTELVNHALHSLQGPTRPKEDLYIADPLPKLLARVAVASNFRFVLLGACASVAKKAVRSSRTVGICALQKF